MLSLNSHSVGFAVAMLFFWLFVSRAGLSHFCFWPTSQGSRRADGDCWRRLSHAQHRTAPVSPLASMLFPSILAPALIGELSFAVWLTVKGVNVARWQEMTE